MFFRVDIVEVKLPGSIEEDSVKADRYYIHEEYSETDVSIL